jgi:hypothetical protein
MKSARARAERFGYGEGGKTACTSIGSNFQSSSNGTSSPRSSSALQPKTDVIVSPSPATAAITAASFSSVLSWPESFTDRLRLLHTCNHFRGALAKKSRPLCGRCSTGSPLSPKMLWSNMFRHVASSLDGMSLIVMTGNRARGAV